MRIRIDYYTGTGGSELVAERLAANIVICDGKAVFGGRCDMCLGCLYGCPQGALKATFWGFQVDKRGYRLAEMFREKNDLPSVDQKIK